MLHVPGGVIHLFKFRAFRPFLLFRRVKPVLSFQFTGDLLAASMLEFVIQRSAVLVHPQAYDVDMVAGYVGRLL